RPGRSSSADRARAPADAEARTATKSAATVPRIEPLADRIWRFIPNSRVSRGLRRRCYRNASRSKREYGAGIGVGDAIQFARRGAPPEHVARSRRTFVGKEVFTRRQRGERPCSEGS